MAWDYKINIGDEFAKAKNDERNIPALTKKIASEVKALNFDGMDSLLRIKLECSIKKLRKAKKFKSFNEEWDWFLTVANHCRIWVNYEAK